MWQLLPQTLYKVSCYLFSGTGTERRRKEEKKGTEGGKRE